MRRTTASDEPAWSPAGLDVGAGTPAETAVSILAELVAERASLGRGGSAGSGSPHEIHDAHEPAGPTDADEGEGSSRADGTAVDPVRETTVDPATAAASVEHDGQTCYFCRESCVATFVEGQRSI